MMDRTEDYDSWFRQKVDEALADPRPSLSHADVMRDVEALIEQKRLAMEAPARQRQVRD